MDQANENALAKLKDRYARLTGRIGVIYIGCFSDIEIKEKKDRIDDALQATRAAIEEGIVPGGGLAYVRALAAVREGSKPEGFNIENDDQAQGTEILFKAILEPIKCICENVGMNGDVVLDTVNKRRGFSIDIAAMPTMTPSEAVEYYSKMGFTIPHSTNGNMNPSYGFNAKTHQYEDLMAAGIIDPTKVTRLALENAASVSGMILTTKAIVTYLPQK